MDDLLGAMMNGDDPESEDGQSGDRGMGDLLGMLGGAASSSQGGQAGGMDMADLLGMMGGAESSSQGGQAGGMDMGALMGMLGGGGSQGSSPMGGILGTLLGGGGLDALVAPLANSLAEKIGLPPEIAQVVVAFALEKLLGGNRAAAAGGRAAGAGDMDELMTQVSRGQTVDAGILESSGMTEELMEKTGLDHETAERSLQEAFGLFGSGMAAGSAPPDSPESPDLGGFSTGGLDGLRDGWE